MNNLVAITGGIGSGKSLFVQYLKNNGYDTLSADEIYGELIKDEVLVTKIYQELQINYTKTPVIFDRKLVSEIVFKDREKLEKLNKITHTLVMEEMLNRAKSLKNPTFCEVPLLFEGGFDKYFDYIIVLMRDKSQRIASVKLRDNIMEEEIENRIKNQYNYDNLKENNHIIIVQNNGNELELYEKLSKVIKKINARISGN